MNRFIKYYNDRKNNGKDPDRAYIDASGKVAAYGEFEDLQELYAHYVRDFADNFVKEIERGVL